MTKPTFFVEEDKILTSLFEEGMESLHLYKPGAAPIYSERLLTLLSDDYAGKITVHEHFYLKEEYKLRGIHIDDSFSPAPDGFKGRLSRTCQSIDDLSVARKDSDYILLKYVFDSLSDDNNKSTLSFEQLKEASQKGLINRRVYAMGGMNLDNIRIAKDLGFGGVVICGDLWNRFDIHQQLDYKELISHFDKLRKAIG